MQISKSVKMLSSLLVVCSIVACSDKAPLEAVPVDTGSTVIDAKYIDIKDAHFKPPVFTEIELDIGVPAAAVWGATGRDNDGRIYFGLSTYKGIHDTAFLAQYDPATGISTAQSDTLTQLKRARLYVDGMSQNKLHSKFFMAEDGYLYFSSFDETGETSTRNPIYGGNLWRKLPDDENWEHLLASDEALIAVNVHGRYVYALGYWDHVLYQYDTITQRSTKLSIGSVPGHISRNFLVNRKGHVFVPRVEQLANGESSTVLVEISPSMAISDLHPMNDYLNKGNFGSHGIVAYTNMKNGDAYFIAASGGLYHIVETATGGHELKYLGKFEGQYENSYIASLFSPDGESLLVGLGRNQETDGYFWYIRELSTQVTVNYPVDTIPKKDYLLYGSITTDDEGNMYIVGRDARNRSRHRPVIIKASYTQ
ncbi:hypothetical protein ACFO4O_08440 [Glaciecola siphonariae]|uniref:Lipoprotein n=1 Tax=Glaciecola siphonariae TaxID=521012 RepID=A0ABV9LX10_9ALTE